MRLFCKTLVTFDLINWSGRGADTVSIESWVGNCSNGSAEKGVNLQLCFCFLIWTLCCHGLSPLINLVIFAEMRRIQSGMNVVSPHQIRFYPESLPVIYVAHIVWWAPPRKPMVERLHVAIHVIINQIGKRARENYGAWHCLGISTHRFHIHFRDLRPAQSGVITAGVYYNLYLRLIFSQQFQTRFNVSCSGPRDVFNCGPWLRYLHVSMNYGAADNQSWFLSGCVGNTG